MVRRSRSATAVAAAVLCAAAMAACTGEQPQPAPSASPPALSAQKLPGVGDVPGMVRSGDFLVMPGSGLPCSSAQSQISAMESAAKRPPASAAVRLSNPDRGREVIVGVWTYTGSNGSGAPEKQLDALARLLPGCTFDSRVAGRPVKAAVDVPAVTGAPDGTRVFRVTDRGAAGVLRQAVIVYITRPGSLLAMEDTRVGPAFPVDETVKLAAAALAKAGV